MKKIKAESLMRRKPKDSLTDKLIVAVLIALAVLVRLPSEHMNETEREHHIGINGMPYLSAMDGRHMRKAEELEGGTWWVCDSLCGEMAGTAWSA